MILTKDSIREKGLFATPLDVFQVNPHSVDLRLAADVLLKAFGDESFKVATTMDRVRLTNDVMGVVYPRSSTNRRGILLFTTGVVDAGYEGGLVLPLANSTEKDILLRKGERVASIVFHSLEEPVEPRLSKYHGASGEYVPDRDEEQRYIEAGDVAGLKERYAA